MKVAVNAIGFTPGSMGGVETYIRNLWQFLQAHETADCYELYCAEKYFDLFPCHNPSFDSRAFNYSPSSPQWLVRGCLRRAIGIDILKSVLNNVDADLIHHPFTVLNPLGLDIPSVLTFWDMQQEFFPEYFSKRVLEKRRKTFAPSARQATRIIVSANFTKKCLVEKYAINPDKIDVVYTGYGPEYQLIEDNQALAKIREKYQLHRPFMFYPAATWPHKNHKGLLHAVKLLRERYRFDGQLVLSGIAMQSQTEILSLISDLGLSDVVKVLGYVPYGDLPMLYNIARLLVFPSYFEGFGIPLVEAMASGCPVVCSNVTSIPEVVGEAGSLFEPGSIEDITEKIWSVWDDEGKRKQMTATGFERAKMFSWDVTARQTVGVYQKALA